MVSAIGIEGNYDIYLMKSECSENRNITPDYFPSDFLCHDPSSQKMIQKIFYRYVTLISFGIYIKFF